MQHKQYVNQLLIQGTWDSTMKFSGQIKFQYAMGTYLRYNYIIGTLTEET